MMGLISAARSHGQEQNNSITVREIPNNGDLIVEKTIATMGRARKKTGKKYRAPKICHFITIENKT